MRISLEDVFGTVAQSEEVRRAFAQLPVDEQKNRYASHTRFTAIGRFNAQLALASSLAKSTMASDANVRLVAARLGVTCEAAIGMPWSGCGESFAAALSTRLKRKAADAGERARLKSVFDKSNQRKADASLAWRGVVQGLLMSPDFLYASDSLKADGSLDGRAVGTRLSLAIAGALPDAPLLADMASGAIMGAAKREEHARRLLAKPSAERAFAKFAEEWFGVPFNPAAATNFPGNPSTTPLEPYRAAIAADFGGAASQPVFRGQGRFADIMLTTAAVPGHPWIASAYGVPQGDSAVALGDEKRGNIFSRVAFLSTKDGGRNLPHRGVFVLERMLCTPLGAPPANATAVAEAISTDGLSHRERWDVITAGANCVGCHRVLNPVGAVFDEFDGWGRYEQTETITKMGQPPRQAPWNVASTIPLPGGVSVAASGPVDLARALGSHDMAKVCFAVNWIDNAFAFENKSNCMLKAASEPLFADTTGGVTEMMIRVVSSPEFLKR
jgi:hypothetical protein